MTPTPLQVTAIMVAIIGKGSFSIKVCVWMDADASRCNMPHVKRETYQRPAEGYELEYVEVVRTPFFQLL